MAKVNKATGEITELEIPQFKRQLSQQQYKTIITTPSKTHQSHAESCDINTVIKTYSRTGVLPHNPRGQEPQYLDVTDLNRPYSEVLDDVRQTKDAIAVANIKKQEKQKLKDKADKAELEKLKLEKQTKPATEEKPL